MIDQPSGISPSVARPPTPLPADFAPLRSQKRRLVAELRDGWEAGRPVSPEELLARWPGDPEADPDVASLLFEDFCQRRQRGESANPSDYSERFPSQHHSLASLVQHQ